LGKSGKGDNSRGKKKGNGGNIQAEYSSRESEHHGEKERLREGGEEKEIN